METKVCGNCKLNKTFTEFKLRGNNYTKKCLECLAKLQKYNDTRNTKRDLNKQEINKANRERYASDETYKNKLKAKSTTYKNLHKAEKTEYQRWYYQANKTQLLEYLAKWRNSHRDHIHAKGKEYRKRCQEKITASKTKWSRINRIKHLSYEHKYRTTNGGDISARNNTRQLKLQATKDWTQNDYNRLLSIQDNCCFYCNNYQERLTIDHVIPLNKAGTNKYTNIVLSCISCNSSKKDSLILDTKNLLKHEANTEYRYHSIITNLSLLAREFNIEQQDNSLIIDNKKLIFHSLFWDTERFQSQNWIQQINNDNYKLGYQTIHFFEDDLYFRLNAVKNIIQHWSNPIKVMARKTQFVLDIPAQTTLDFLNQNHILGRTPNIGIRCGLIYGNELVAVACFSDSAGDRNLPVNHLELTRLAFKNVVVGGFSKIVHNLFKHIDNLDGLISYVDLMFSLGASYEATNWRLLSVGKLDYEYVIRDHRERKSRYAHSGMNERLEYYSNAVSERDNMINNGFFRIWKLPKMKYQYLI